MDIAAAVADLLNAYNPAYLPTDMKAVDADTLDGFEAADLAPTYLKSSGGVLNNLSGGTVVCETDAFTADRDMAGLLKGSVSARADSGTGGLFLRLTAATDGGSHSNISENVSSQIDVVDSEDRDVDHQDVTIVSAGQTVVFGIRLNGCLLTPVPSSRPLPPRVRCRGPRGRTATDEAPDAPRLG